jgi:hypothetical protein
MTQLFAQNRYIDNKGVYLENQSNYFSIEIKKIILKTDLTNKIVTK